MPNTHNVFIFIDSLGALFFAPLFSITHWEQSSFLTSFFVRAFRHGFEGQLGNLPQAALAKIFPPLC
jgi:hypothetical protein